MEAPRSRFRVGVLDVLCVGPIIALTIYWSVGRGITPALLGHHPVLLELIRPTSTALVTAGAYAKVGRAWLLAALLAPIPMSMAADPFLFWAGRRYGRRVLDAWSRQNQRTRRRIARGERWVRDYGFWIILANAFLPVGSAVLFLAAGEARMRWRVFLLADLVSTLLWTVLFVGLGWLAGAPAAKFADSFANLSAAVPLWVWIAGPFAIATAWNVIQTNRDRRRPPEPR
ncbi:MAG: DedA family protein [Candidatus Dormibacteria bacterium]